VTAERLPIAELLPAVQVSKFDQVKHDRPPEHLAAASTSRRSACPSPEIVAPGRTARPGEPVAKSPRAAMI